MFIQPLPWHGGARGLGRLELGRGGWGWHYGVRQCERIRHWWRVGEEKTQGETALHCIWKPCSGSEVSCTQQTNSSGLLSIGLCWLQVGGLPAFRGPGRSALLFREADSLTESCSVYCLFDSSSCCLLFILSHIHPIHRWHTGDLILFNTCLSCICA